MLTETPVFKDFLTYNAHHWKIQVLYPKTKKSLNFLSANDSYMIAIIKNADKP